MEIDHYNHGNLGTNLIITYIVFYYVALSKLIIHK
jgi:hypothetical protein